MALQPVRATKDRATVNMATDEARGRGGFKVIKNLQKSG
jgi:hypothetical protein